MQINDFLCNLEKCSCCKLYCNTIHTAHCAFYLKCRCSSGETRKKETPVGEIPVYRSESLFRQYHLFFWLLSYHYCCSVTMQKIFRSLPIKFPFSAWRKTKIQIESFILQHHKQDCFACLPLPGVVFGILWNRDKREMLTPRRNLTTRMISETKPCRQKKTKDNSEQLEKDLRQNFGGWGRVQENFGFHRTHVSMCVAVYSTTC